MEINKKIPEGGVYLSHGKKSLKKDDRFPVPKHNDEFYYGDYKYTYDVSINGWNAKVILKNKSSYGEILESINDMPVTDLNATFINCCNLKVAPKIHQNIMFMNKTFRGCSSLIETPEIPDNVVSISGTFSFCYSLTKVTNLPKNISSMQDTFERCVSLTTIPKIPDGVLCLNNTFLGCSSLLKAPELPAGGTHLVNTFYGCSALKTVPNLPEKAIDMSHTFTNCKSLISVPPIPKSAIILDETFKGCESLKSITFNDSEARINSSFDNNAELTVKGLLKSNAYSYKTSYPNIKFKNISELSQFLKNKNRNNIQEK